jgi:hypothetical protein
MARSDRELPFTGPELSWRELTTHDAANNEHVDGLVVVGDLGADALDVSVVHQFQENGRSM